ncbi:hypothetical protein BGZ99_005847 [Dissophora globulifera]|uniref:Uncharacterized protein n=1 Tax=Dissophora globulifera TaxID=979702 RepID=A0A9P6RGH9_9FUNG|nr:hypothetical protein BGZ99_005847 [Dissophora globulifera]
MKTKIRTRVLREHHGVTRHPAAPKDSEYPLKRETPRPASASTSSSTSSTATKTPGPYGVSRQTMDFTELPTRYRHPQLTDAEIEAVEAGGATIIY